MAELQMRRFQTRVLKSDGTGKQIPASGSGFQVYRQGAIARGDDVTIPALDTGHILVYDSGHIRVDDQLLLNGDPGKQLGVLAIDLNGRGMDVENQSTSAITIHAGDRLVLFSNLPKLWVDPQGTVEFTGRTLDSNGATAFFCAEERFDLVFSNVPSAPPILADLPGGWARGDATWVNAKDYATLQDAVDALPSSGGTVFLPTGGYWPTSRPAFNPPLVLPHDRPVRLLGEGPFLTALQYSRMFAGQDYDPDLDFIQLQGDYQSVEGIGLLGDGGGIGSGVGVRIRRAVATTNACEIVFGASVRNCRIVDTPSWGIKVDTTPVAGHGRFAIWTCYDQVEVRSHNPDGVVYIGGDGTNTQFFKNCHFLDFKGCGVKSDGAPFGAHGVSLIDCVLASTRNVPFISLHNSHDALIQHCWLEGKNAATTPYVEARGNYQGLRIDSCHFGQDDPQAELYAIHVGGTGRAVLISGIDVFWLGTTPPQSSHYHVVIENDDPVPPNSPPPPQISEVVIVGGSVTDASGSERPLPGHLRVLDRSGRTALLNGMWRIRLPQVSQDDVDELTGVSPGDMVYNKTTHRAQIRGGTGAEGQWHDLWWGRMRLARLSQDEINNLTDVAGGEMVYNTTTQKAQARDESGWHDLW